MQKIVNKSFMIIIALLIFLAFSGPAEAKYIVACEEYGTYYMIQDEDIDADKGIVPVTIYKEGNTTEQVYIKYDKPYYEIKCTLVDQDGNKIGKSPLSIKVEKAVLRTVAPYFGIYYDDDPPKVHIFPNRD